MSGAYPFILFCATGVLWFTTVWYAHRLLHAFCRRFPSEAQREIPHAFDRWFAHPEKGIFFFRHKAVEILRGDALLWRQRQRFILLSVLSVVIPVLGFMSVGVVAILESQK
jgi:hypothetical protein